jgi:hypothetical protein
MVVRAFRFLRGGKSGEAAAESPAGRDAQELQPGRCRTRNKPASNVFPTEAGGRTSLRIAWRSHDEVRSHTIGMEVFMEALGLLFVATALLLLVTAAVE